MTEPSDINPGGIVPGPAIAYLAPGEYVINASALNFRQQLEELPPEPDEPDDGG